MALIDDIEFYGRAVAAREMTLDAATAALVETSNGGLTAAGARGLIQNWRTARGRYEQEHNRAFHGKAAIENGRRPHPSSKPKR